MAVIVISVGTSLLTNNREEISDHYDILNGELQGEHISVQDMKELSFNFDGNGELTRVVPNKVDGLYSFSKSFFGKYLDESCIKDNIQWRTQGLRDLLPAEISSLYLYYYNAEGVLRNDFKGRLSEGSEDEFSVKDEIELLTTDTPDAVYCARMLSNLIQRIDLFNKKCSVSQESPKVIDNLDVYDPTKYAKSNISDSTEVPEGKGLTNLYDYFVARFEAEDRPDLDKILIRTGGYKEFSADLKLMAINFGFTSLYLFEKSTKFLRTYTGGWTDDLATIIGKTTWLE